MSSSPVRAAFREEWASYAPGVAYFDVVNKPVRLRAGAEAGTLQGCLGFAVTERKDTTLGANPYVEETGIVTIKVFGPSGSSDAATIEKATEIQRRLAGRLLRPDILVPVVFGPIDDQPEGEGGFYQVQLAADYVFQTRETRLNPGG